MRYYRIELVATPVKRPFRPSQTASSPSVSHSRNLKFELALVVSSGLESRVAVVWPGEQLAGQALGRRRPSDGIRPAGDCSSRQERYVFRDELRNILTFDATVGLIPVVCGPT